MLHPYAKSYRPVCPWISSTPNTMRPSLLFPALFLALTAAAAVDVDWVPEGLPPLPTTTNVGLGHYLKPEQGKAVLDAALTRFPDRTSWEAYAAHARRLIQEGAGLAPWPKRTPLNAVVRNRRVYDGYTVENVCFESVPGCFVTGN